MAGKGRNEVWGPRNDQIVIMHYSGVPQSEIAKHFGISPSAVSDICNDPRGEEIIERARNHIHQRLMEDIELEMDTSTKLAAKAVKKTLEADIAPVHKAKPNQDRVALAILKGRGVLREDSVEGGGGIQMSPDQHKALMSAISKSDEAREIDPFANVQDAEVVEGDENG